MTVSEHDAHDPLLTSDEWLGLTRCILAVNEASTHEDMRFQALKALRALVPFETAAFFLADASGERLDGCLIAQPVGTDVPADEFERRIDAAYSSRSSNASGPVALVCEPGTTENGRAANPRSHVTEDQPLLACRFRSGDDLLGALALCRTASQGSFDERDRFALEVLAPHLTQRLKALNRRRGDGTLRSEPLRREYRLTKRELDVMGCIAYGMTIPEIAVKLTISPGTARKHLENIYRKVGVNNRMSLMKFAQQYVAM